MKKIKKPVSIVLALMMVVSLFAIVPITASAAEETSTVTWNSFPGTGGMSSGGVTLTTTQGNTRVSNCFYPGRGTATFTAPEGSVFTKIELKNCEYVSSLNFPGATVAQSGGYWKQAPWDDEPEWVSYYTVTWTGESSEVTFSGDFAGIQSIVFTLKSVAPPTYTVTWKNGETVLKTDTVEGGTAPAYSGDVPEKAEDENNTYTFSGWTDGTNTYGATDTLPAVAGDITYTATFTETAKPKDLFPQHSVSLGGDIGVNFYIDPAAAGANEHATVSVEFSWNGQSETVAAEYDDGKGLFRATCDVVAAEVACDITAVATVNGAVQTQTDTYSVQDYAEAVYNNPTEYDTKGRPDKLQALAKALLNYGAMAQTVFVEYMKQPVKAPATIVSTVGKTDFNAITADDIPGGATDLKDIATELGFKYYTSSVFYLQNNTLRLYFTPNTYQDAMPHVGDFDGNQSDYYYYVEKTNIAAAELDDQQTFKVGGKEFTFSALDYAKAVVNSDNMKPEQKNLAKALYLYNKAANEYFDDAPAPTWNTVDLSTLTGDYEAQNYDLLTGTLSGNKKITIADGATVTLKDANITLNSMVKYAGITLLGDATIMLEGTNTVKCGKHNAGIYVPADKTLTINGTGSLDASSNGHGCGIGGGYEIAAGNIVINGGTITATGGDYAAGIGSGDSGSCGNITITGGTITANGGEEAAGIGSGPDSTCGKITIADTVTQVTATKGKYSPNSIGAGTDGSCGTVTIEDNSKVTQN